MGGFILITRAKYFGDSYKNLRTIRKRNSKKIALKLFLYTIQSVDKFLINFKRITQRLVLGPLLVFEFINDLFIYV